MMHRRQFLAAAGSAAALATAPGVLARAPLAGEARRKTPDAVDLTWTQGSPATVRVSTDPDAAPGAMRLLQSGVRASHAEEPAPISPRPYFLVSTSDGGQVRLAERLLPLTGGRNFRDLGGYRAAGGRQVRWGRLFRSGVMSGLTLDDMRYLTSLGVRVICDLRSIEERTRQPNAFIAHGGDGAPHVVATDYEMFKLDALHSSRTRQEAIEGFSDAYLDFTQRLTPQYTDMFDRLVRGDAPLAVNCSAGKDRTGMASALILTLLGVPRETVIADYALTQVYSPPPDPSKLTATATSAGLSPDQVAMFARMPPEVLAVMGGSDPAIMRRTLEKIDAQFGGPVALAKSRYGLTDDKLARLRQLYLS